MTFRNFILTFFILSLSAFGAISDTMQWNVQTTASDLNGCGYNAAGSSPGTNYMLQDAPQVTFDGATITASNGGAGATITITGYTVVATDNRNTLRVSAGTNFTVGVYEIVSVNTGANTWTLDRNITSGAGSAMEGRMGGGCATIATAISSSVATVAFVFGNKINIKAGTYTLTSGLTLSGSHYGVQLIGYGSTPGDGGTHPLITSATNSVDLITFSNARGNMVDNIDFSHTAGTRGNCIYGGATSLNIIIKNAIFDGCARAVYAINVNLAVVTIINVEAKNCTTTNNTDGCISIGSSLYMDRVYVHDGAAHGFQSSNDTFSPMIVIMRSTFANNAYAGVRVNNISGLRTTTIDRCNFYGNGDSGINAGDPIEARDVFTVTNSIFWGNTGYGIEMINNFTHGLNAFNNAFGDNSLGARLNMNAYPGDVTLTADPFADAPTGNFALNSTAGGGAALKSAGAPGVAYHGTGFEDIGALQATGSGGSSNRGGNVINRGVN